MTRPVIEVRNLTKNFRHHDRTDFAAVKNVNLTLGEGEILGVIGESGCGKSTLVKLITRLEDATEGSILLDGTDVTRLTGRALRPLYDAVQMVFQTPRASFDPRRTLGDGIGESLINRGVSKEDVRARVSDLLRQCDLDPAMADRYPHEVSGGQCQRAAIARSLAVEPRVLICDEATSSLDVTVQKQIIDLLVRLNATRGMAILFISHNLALVQSFCSRVAVMNAGSIVELGTAEEVICNPQSDVTRKLLDAVF